MNTGSMILAQTAAPAQPSAPVTEMKEIQTAVPAAAQTAKKALSGKNQTVVEVPDTKSSKPQPGWWESIGPMVPMILIIVVMFYLMYRGQKKEQKRRQEMISALKKDDRIVTVGGIYAQVVEVRDDHFKVRIANNTEIEIAKSAVGSVLNAETGGAASK